MLEGTGVLLLRCLTRSFTCCSAATLSPAQAAAHNRSSLCKFLVAGLWLGQVACPGGGTSAVKQHDQGCCSGYGAVWQSSDAASCLSESLLSSASCTKSCQAQQDASSKLWCRMLSLQAAPLWSCQQTAWHVLAVCLHPTPRCTGVQQGYANGFLWLLSQLS